MIRDQGERKCDGGYLVLTGLNPLKAGQARQTSVKTYQKISHMVLQILYRTIYK